MTPVSVPGLCQNDQFLGFIRGEIGFALPQNMEVVMSPFAAAMSDALRIDLSAFLLDIETGWTLNALLARLSSFRKCSKRRILDHSARATSLLPTAGMTKG